MVVARSSANLGVGHGGTGFEPANMRGENGECVKHEEVAGHETDFDGLGVRIDAGRVRLM
jgi:hypothetical protein